MDESCESETVVKIGTDKSTRNQQLINGNLDNEESTSQIKATRETAFNHNIVETKELLQYRPDNIAYFVASNGSPCDKGNKALLEANKIPVKLYSLSLGRGIPPRNHR